MHTVCTARFDKTILCTVDNDINITLCAKLTIINEHYNMCQIDIDTELSKSTKFVGTIQTGICRELY
jgi:hypothetical protein